MVNVLLQELTDTLLGQFSSPHGFLPSSSHFGRQNDLTSDRVNLVPLVVGHFDSGVIHELAHYQGNAKVHKAHDHLAALRQWDPCRVDLLLQGLVRGIDGPKERHGHFQDYQKLVGNQCNQARVAVCLSDSKELIRLQEMRCLFAPTRQEQYSIESASSVCAIESAMAMLLFDVTLMKLFWLFHAGLWHVQHAP